MLTADTITDDQIRALRTRQRDEGNRINVDICNTALSELRGARGQTVSFVGGEIHDARARCAKAINDGE